MRVLLIVVFLFLSSCGHPSIHSTTSTERSSDAGVSVKYRCESGKTIIATYPTVATAIVKYGSRDIQMNITVSASGARYIGERLEWWTKGSGEGATGTLFRHLEDGTSGEAIEQCWLLSSRM